MEEEGWELVRDLLVVREGEPEGRHQDGGDEVEREERQGVVPRAQEGDGVTEHRSGVHSAHAAAAEEQGREAEEVRERRGGAASQTRRRGGRESRVRVHEHGRRGAQESFCEALHAPENGQPTVEVRLRSREGGAEERGSNRAT